MAITVKHSKVSTIPDEADTSLVRPSDWNDDHVLTGTVPVANGGTGASTANGAITNLLPSQTSNSGKFLSTDGTNTLWSVPAGSGDVVGPASSTDNAIARFDSTTGKLIQNSVVTIGDTGAATGFTTLAASTSVTTPIVQATNSGGLALKNSAGTTQMSMGAGGGDNMSINVSTNINGTNAQIDISPTGTGHVHIKPSGTNSVEIAPISAGTMNNMVIGGTTAAAGSFTDLSVTGTTSFDGSQGTAGQVLTSAGTGATPTWTTPTVGDVVGPASATDNAVARFDSTTGKLIQNSTVTIDDSGQLNLTNASNYNLYASGAGNNYMLGKLGIGTLPATDTNLLVSKNLTGATNAFNIYSLPTAQSDVTVLSSSYFSFPATQATAFTLANVRHYDLAGVSVGSGSTVTTQVGYYSRALTTATNNYAFQGVVAAATGAYNLYMNGSANNYLAGRLGVGTTALTTTNLRVQQTITGGTICEGVFAAGTVQSDVTATARYFRTFGATQATAFTLGTLQHYSAEQGTFGASSSVTTQYGFIANSSLIGATSNFGFYGDIAAGANRWNLYMNGTANNYLASSLGIGTTTLTDRNLAIGKTITGATTAYGIVQSGTVQSDVTNTTVGTRNVLNTAAASFTLSNYLHFGTVQNSIGASSAVTSQYGYHVENSLTGATNNYGFYGNIAAATGRYNLYMAGTAANYFGGDMQFDKTVTAGGTTGARTISKNAGTVNFAAAATSLVVTNTLVTTSSIIICTVGTNDTTMKSVSAVAAAGSFTIFSNAAATAETRVNFIVIN